MAPVSKFTPPDFDPKATLALLAGRGVYPVEMSRELDRRGIRHVLIAFEGETPPELWEKFPSNGRLMLNVGQLGKLLRGVSLFGAKYAAMAGQITPGKLFRGMTPDLKAITVLASLKKRNAETIFGAVAAELAKVGVEMIDARSFMDASVAPRGFFTGDRSWKISDSDLEHAVSIARECARLDIGQGCVTSHGTVLAVEAYEGTDAMLERAGSFGAKDCLFAKTVKPRQDYRFDVPVIGGRTVGKLAGAGIFNVAVEADKVIILEPEKTRELAQKLGVKIFGVWEL